MDNQTLKSALTKIEILWTTTAKEKGYDPRSYEYIAMQSMAFKQAVVELKLKVAEQINGNKKNKLKYQKLHTTLNAIQKSLDFELTPCKDEKYIQSILDKLKQNKTNINTIMQYQEQ